MSGKNLPPLWLSPHWTGADIASQECSPRSLQSLQSLYAVPLMVRGVEVPGTRDGSVLEVDRRIASLQKNIQFLQQQHKETLEKLHAEVEYLSKENKELKYKLIMEEQKTSKKGIMGGIRDSRPPTQVREAYTGFHLEDPLKDTTIPLQDLVLSLKEDSEVPQSTQQNHGHLITSLKPLRIHSSPSHPPRAPTLQECEVIIQQLFSANSSQSQEIAHVKALLRDIVLKKKITPEHLALSKAYLANGPCKAVKEKKFPRHGPLSSPAKVSGPSPSGAAFPSLKISFSSNIANRQKKT
ncbi:coiled-coil domain-containing protein 74B [Anableps anableps]